MRSSNEPERIAPRANGFVERMMPSAETANYLVRQARKIIAGVVGATVALLGVAMLVLPGPGIVVLFFGLSILAAEFAWARSLLKRLKTEGKRVIPERWRRIFFRKA